VVSREVFFDPAEEAVTDFQDVATFIVEFLTRTDELYFAFACLLCSIWRAADLLMQVELTGEYDHSPIVTADNTLTLLKKNWPTSPKALRVDTTPQTV
jgi:hypothetical protein